MITISGLVLALSFLSINTRNFVLASVAFVRHTSRVGAAIPSNLQGEKELPEAIAHLLRIRGGESTALDDDDEEDDYSEEEEDDEELDASLAASAVKATVKGKKKQTNSKIKKAKSAVNKELAAKATKTEKVAAKKKHKSSSTFRVPYIIRACLNPMTIVKMTTAYWASLFKLDYLKQVGHSATNRLVTLNFIPC